MAGDLARDIADVQSIRAIPTILDIVCRTTGMRFAAVARVTEDRWIACSVRDDIAFGLVPGGELKVETTLCHEVRQSGQAIVIDHVAANPTYASHHTPSIYCLQSYIAMPIRLTDGSFFGTLCAIDPEPHVLNTPETISMFGMFADVIGFHLSTIDGLAAAESHLRDERRTASLREQFIAVLAHDLRNPLAAINGGMHLLLGTPLNKRATDIVHMVQNSVERAAGLIDNVMDFARGRHGDGISIDRVAVAHLEPMLRHVIAELQVTAPARVIETDFAIAGPVTCDRLRIGQLLSNLLANALTHGATDHPVRVVAATRDGCFELSVANAGDPIPEAAMDAIFEPFSRGSLKPDLHGLGLGLYIAHQIAVAHGGTLTAVSSPAETRFSFRMNLA